MKIKRVDHIGVAVASIEPFKKLYTEILGLPLTHEEDYLGEAKIAFFPAGDTDVEFFASLHPDGELAHSVAKEGERIDHIAFVVEDIDQAVRELKAKGIPLVQPEPVPGARGSRIVFLDASATRGIKVELVQPGNLSSLNEIFTES
jgi:methylmalonyl-CoA/ethylmalonyl-CoA epimerase